MLESIAPILGALKKSTPAVLTAALIASSLILFMPNELAVSIGVSEARETYRLPLGLVLVISLCLLITQALFALSPWINGKTNAWSLKRNMRTALEGCTDAEKQLLRRYIIDGENTVQRSLYDGVAGGLVAKRILYRAANVTVPGVPGMLMPYNLQPVARQILNNERSLLD